MVKGALACTGLTAKGRKTQTALNQIEVTQLTDDVE